MTKLIQVKNIEIGLSVLKEMAIDLELEAQGLSGETASEAWTRHHRVNAVVLRCESLLRAGQTSDVHTLLFAEGINVTGRIKQQQRSPRR